MATQILDDNGIILGVVAATQTSTVHNKGVTRFGPCCVDAVIIWDQFDRVVEPFNVTNRLHKEVGGTCRQKYATMSCNSPVILSVDLVLMTR